MGGQAAFFGHNSIDVNFLDERFKIVRFIPHNTHAEILKNF